MIRKALKWIVKRMLNLSYGKFAESSEFLKPVEPYQSSPRYLVIGFDSVEDVPAGGTLTIVARSQVLFKPNRLVVSPLAASSFLIDDIRIGKSSQFAAPGPIPAAAFSSSQDVMLQFETAQIAQEIAMVVTNFTSSPERFSAVMMGITLEY